MNSRSRYQALADKWPSPVVLRSQVGKFSNGILNPDTLRNWDSQKCGPEGKFYIGRKVAYPTESVIRFLDLLTEDVSNQS